MFNDCLTLTYPLYPLLCIPTVAPTYGLLHAPALYSSPTPSPSPLSPPPRHLFKGRVCIGRWKWVSLSVHAGNSFWLTEMLSLPPTFQFHFLPSNGNLCKGENHPIAVDGEFLVSFRVDVSPNRTNWWVVKMNRNQSNLVELVTRLSSFVSTFLLSAQEWSSCDQMLVQNEICGASLWQILHSNLWVS